jgi:hypothetical protein
MWGYMLVLDIAIQFLLSMKDAMAQNSNVVPFQRTADYEDLFISNTTAKMTIKGYSIIACAINTTSELIELQPFTYTSIMKPK